MGLATKKLFFAATLAAMLVAGTAGAVSPQSSDAPNYFTKHFSTDALADAVKSAVTDAHLAPVSFHHIVVHTRDQVTTSGQGSPTTYTVTMMLEDAGQGLIRRTQAVQSHEGNTVTRFDLTYRGYFPFLSQSIPASANALPPVIETRKVMRFDTHVDGHFSFVYLFGPSGQATFADPGQVICDSGKSYAAAQVSPAIQGQALELNCQTIDNNGITTGKTRFAYLEKYGVALMLHTQNPESSLDSAIVDFTVE
ncbi:hypothetical protein [Dyella mobilis]|uniref:Secreted protein n=1 Tax=Dyella mobilis TaxID=1849582 RepID=A0ABS2KGN4_9GAMM|nr:hypothetical protein [Dyella mobilis]MBM7130329.1 hypothetical protein [Dyella mobilis]GLQ96955.1 hypothetical protein GCM10007863_13750 [Dyella mobilis]